MCQVLPLLFWRGRIVPLLMAAGRLTELDRDALVIYCTAFADWLAAKEALQTCGAVIKSPSGYPVQSPYVAIAAKNLDTIVRLGVEFGLTPASRRRLPSPANGNSWMDEFPTLDASDFKTLTLDPPDEA